MLIERTTDATRLNAILNDPAVRPWVADAADGALDVTPQVSNPHNVTLVGEYGAFFCYKYCDGVYEVHTQVLPAGRGEWALEFAKAGAEFMFVATDCVEILTRVPQGHVAAKALTDAMGFRHQFTTPADCLFRGKNVPCHIYTLNLAEWSTRVEGMREQGALFHNWLNRQVGKDAGEPHAPDPAHDLWVGIALAMVGFGQVQKGVVWYNRAAIAARHATIALLNLDPPQIRFDAGVLTYQNGQLKFERSH